MLIKGIFQFHSVYDVKAIKYTYNLKPILLVQILEHWQGLPSINFQSLLVCFGIVLPSHFSSPRKVFSQFYFRAIDQHQNWFYTNLLKANDVMLVISMFEILTTYIKYTMRPDISQKLPSFQNGVFVLHFQEIHLLKEQHLCQGSPLFRAPRCLRHNPT